MLYDKLARITTLFLLVFCATVHGTETDAGRKAYLTHCSGCHSTDPVVNHYAPNLHCIVGRRAGVADYNGYSVDFMEVTGELVWTEEMLIDYLADQGEFVAGTLGAPDARILMNVVLPDASLGADIVAYLVSLCSE